MMKPELVVFDLGQVLVKVDYVEVAGTLKMNCRNGSWMDIDRHIQAALNDYERGLVDDDIFFKRFKEKFGFDASQEKFESAFEFPDIEESLDVVSSVKMAGVKTALFSNLGPVVGRSIQKRRLYDLFDFHVLSYERGIMKPNQKFYKILEEVSGFSGHKVMFFDDRLENIDTAFTMGWRAFQFCSAESMKEQLAAAGLSV
jgi:HAD superfamily hydrolase (TIGR01509 family)